MKELRRSTWVSLRVGCGVRRVNSVRSEGVTGGEDFTDSLAKSKKTEFPSRIRNHF